MGNSFTHLLFGQSPVDFLERFGRSLVVYPPHMLLLLMNEVSRVEVCDRDHLLVLVRLEVSIAQLGMYELGRRSSPGDGVNDPGNFITRVGTPVETLLSLTGMKEDANKLIFGGPMMGIAQQSADGNTVKGTGGILVMREAETWESHACIRCGKCVESCPYGLNPSYLSIFCEAENFQGAMEYDLMECKECGCCTYVCTSRRPIVHLIKMAKFDLGRQRARAQAKQKAEEAAKQVVAAK